MFNSLLIALILSSPSQAVPQQLSQQGRLLDSSGVAISGSHNLTFRIFDSPSAPAALWEESLSVNFDNGYYKAILGANSSFNPLDQTVLSIEPLYLEVEVDNNGPMTPRQTLNSAPYAKMAGTTQNLEGGSVNADSISVNGTLVIDPSGSWVGPTMTVNWNNIINIPSDIADGDNDTLAGLNCGTGQIVGWDGNQWVCTADNGLTESQVENFITNGQIDLFTGSTVNGNAILSSADTLTPEWGNIQNRPAGLDDGDDDALGGLFCLEGEVAGWDGLNWVCVSDSSLTEAEVENFITNAPIDLAAGTTLNGQTILSSAACGDGEILIHDSVSGWTCSSFNTLIDADSDGVMAWSDCDDNDPLALSFIGDADCDGTETAEDCNDNDPSSETIYTDGDCDGNLTAEDCDDNDPTSTTPAIDADCDGILTADDCDDNDPNPILPGASNCPGISCADILAQGGSVGDGNYWITQGGNTFEVSCDMSTDGGGWTLVLNYLYQAGSGANTQTRSTELPLKGSESLGVNENGSAQWGHASNSMMNNLDPSELIFYCRSSNHNRVIHFKTSHPDVMSYVKTGNGSMVGVYDSSQTVSMPMRNNSTLPLHTNGENSHHTNSGNSALTEFPFYSDSGIGNPRAHWGIQGGGVRWECDDSSSNTHALWRVWAR